MNRFLSLSALLAVSFIFSACNELHIQDGRLPTSISIHNAAPYLGEFHTESDATKISIFQDDEGVVSLILSKSNKLPPACQGTKANLTKLGTTRLKNIVTVDFAEFTVTGNDCLASLTDSIIRVEYLGPKKAGQIKLSFASDYSYDYHCPGLVYDSDFDAAVLSCEWDRTANIRSLELMERRSIRL